MHSHGHDMPPRGNRVHDAEFVKGSIHLPGHGLVAGCPIVVDDERRGDVAILGNTDEHVSPLHRLTQMGVTRMLVVLPEDVKVRPLHLLDHVVVEIHDGIHVSHRRFTRQKKSHHPLPVTPKCTSSVRIRHMSRMLVWLLRRAQYEGTPIFTLHTPADVRRPLE